MLYYEATDRMVVDWNHFSNEAGTARNYITGNHGGFNNVATSFVDGHVEFAPRYVRTDVESYDPLGNPLHTGNFAMRGSRLEAVRMPEGPPNETNSSRNVLFNGDNWTMHCFPAPEVDTATAPRKSTGPWVKGSLPAINIAL